MNRREEAQQLGYVPINGTDHTDRTDEGDNPDLMETANVFLDVVQFLKGRLGGFDIGFKEEASVVALIQTFFDSLR